MLYDAQGNKISPSTPKEELTQDNTEKEQEPELTKAEELYVQFSETVKDSIEKNVTRAKLTNFQLNQQQFMEVVNILNQTYLYKIFEFLSDSIGIEDFSMIIDEKAKEEMDNIIQFQQKLEPTAEEIEEFSKKPSTKQ